MMRRLFDHVHLWRPKHWVKNVFVLMPVPFGLAAGARADAGQFLLGFVGFCFATSAVYALNDVIDAEQDRRHPRKQERPVASGRLRPVEGLASAAVALGVALGLSWTVHSTTAITLVGVYVGLNVTYSLGAKHVPLIDVFILSSGFVLRVLLGCALIDVRPSSWLLLCSSALALFLALAKRRGDLVRGVGPDHRPSLRGYNVEFLNQAITISTALTLMSYALYTMEAEVLVPGREFASLP
ncbi:MAG TPA: UbiA prenyltransferase family protein, partial [Candidatus Polarisedimenticolaceae bacterium]|nr:UbiA prenyltransferase family protein [Candidatus Polarisedimenticolaceae bacterium]